MWEGKKARQEEIGKKKKSWERRKKVRGKDKKGRNKMIEKI